MEQYSLRNLVGTPCGAGDQEKLDTVWSINPVTKLLDSSGDSWIREEVGTRTIAAGTWDVLLDYNSTTGGGPKNKVRALVTVRDSSCNVKQTILDEEVVISKGKTGARIVFPGVDPGAVSLDAGDKVVLELFKTNGNQNVEVRYNGHVSSDSSSRLRHPDVATPPGRVDVSHIEVAVQDPA